MIYTKLNADKVFKEECGNESSQRHDNITHGNR